MRFDHKWAGNETINVDMCFTQSALPSKHKALRWINVFGINTKPPNINNNNYEFSYSAHIILRVFHTYHHWYINMFHRVPFQLPGEYIALQPFRHYNTPVCRLAWAIIEISINRITNDNNTLRSWFDWLVFVLFYCRKREEIRPVQSAVSRNSGAKPQADVHGAERTAIQK